MSNPFEFIRQIFSRLAGVSSTEAAVEMRQVFGPDAAFSIMVPMHWLDRSQTDRLAINAPGDGPALAGSAWRMDEEVSLRQFADARFAGVKDMRLYSQVGKEYTLAENGSLIREYQGRWQGDRKTTSYVVACLGAGSVRVSVTLTTDQRDYRKNRPFYRRMLASLQVHAAPAGGAVAV